MITNPTGRILYTSLQSASRRAPGTGGLELGCWDFGFLRAFGGTPNRDPCSLWGLILGLPSDIGVIY